MTATELKQNKYIYNADFEISDLEKEYVSLSNNEGGKIEIQLENRIDLRALNKAIVDAADNCIPRILVHTKNEIKDNKLIVIISVPQGNQKPYRTKSGELQRMVLNSAGISIEELPIHNSSIETDIDKGKLYLYFEQEYKTNIPDFCSKMKLAITSYWKI